MANPLQEIAKIPQRRSSQLTNPVLATHSYILPLLPSGPSLLSLRRWINRNFEGKCCPVDGLYIIPSRNGGDHELFCKRVKSNPTEFFVSPRPPTCRIESASFLALPQRAGSVSTASSERPIFPNGDQRYDEYI